jgi:hypothetical protein
MAGCFKKCIQDPGIGNPSTGYLPLYHALSRFLEIDLSQNYLN